MGRIVEVTRWLLEMRLPEEFRPAFIETESRVEQVADPPPSLFRYLYGEVGREYHWLDRLAWTDDQIREYLRGPCLSFWVLYVDQTPAGYFELLCHAEDASMEIVYFGLLRAYFGRGLGKHLLSVAVREASQAGASRVWLHTTSLDGVAALPNYLARGFRVTGAETEYLSVDG